MARSRNRIADELIKYIETLGIDVHTNTKAGGNKGFLRGERIDISKKISNEEILPVLMHEFAHYIHMKKDKKLNNLELIFNTNDKRIEEELISVTNFVDNNSLCTNLLEEKQKTIKNIKSLENSIKEDYPNFSRGQKSKEIEKQIKKSKAKYLLKYDKVKLFRLFGYEILSTETIERDFPSMPSAFINYIKLRSLQRKRSRISARINKLSKYYQNAGELFARFVEGLVKDRQEIERLAPTTYEQFFKLLNTGYYGELKQAFELIRNNTTTLESEILK